MVSSQVAETIEGIVLRTNERGLLLDVHDGWLNVSRYAAPAPAIPAEGARVSVGLDKSGFVRTIEVLAQPPPREVAETAGAYAPPLDRDVRIMRQALLNTSTAILSSGGRVADEEDVVALAERLERWVTR